MDLYQEKSYKTKKMFSLIAAVHYTAHSAGKDEGKNLVLTVFADFVLVSWMDQDNLDSLEMALPDVDYFELDYHY